MTKYLDIHQRVKLFLAGSVTVDDLDDLVLNGINAALIALLLYLPNRKATKISIDSIGDTSPSFFTVKLPSDVYQVDSVFDNFDKIWLKHLVIKGGDVLEASQVPSWFEYPQGYLSLTPKRLDDRLNDIKDLVIFYFSNWDYIVATQSGNTTIEPYDDASDIELQTPPFADNAIVYYACAYCLTSSATNTSSLRQYDTRIDSGTPTDNPVKDIANLMMLRFSNEVKTFPVIEKAVK